MSRIANPPSEDAANERFGEVLADVRRAAAGPDTRPRDDRASPAAAPRLASAVFPLDVNRPQATGGAANWQAALAWLEDQDEPTAIVASPRVAEESAEAVLAELGLRNDLSQRELDRLRRLYMWRNHPDRCREAQRAGATRRVAIANMLLDRAQSQLADRGPSKN